MRSRFHNESDVGEGTAFRDVFLTMAGVLGALLVILILLPKQPEQAAEDAQRARGNIRVEVFWPDDYNVDIDTWGKAPGQVPIGYSNMNGPVLNLVRDDLGNYADISGRNYEIMFSRGLPQGEWIFNIHWFSNAGNKTSVPVTVLISITHDDSAGTKERPKQIVSTKLTLTTQGEEQTVIRFNLDHDGNLIPDSLTSIFKPIRGASSAAGSL